jgi:hypothetical protein
MSVSRRVKGICGGESLKGDGHHRNFQLRQRIWFNHKRHILDEHANILWITFALPVHIAALSLTELDFTAHSSRQNTTQRADLRAIYKASAERI